jgi:hypothetical protein
MKTVKFLLIGLFTILFFSNSSYNSNFCEGFEQGFKQGYCYNRGTFGCIPPITPLCPLPNYGQDSYRDGYNLGFTRGLNY